MNADRTQNFVQYCNEMANDFREHDGAVPAEENLPIWPDSGYCFVVYPQAVVISTAVSWLSYLGLLW